MKYGYIGLLGVILLFGFASGASALTQEVKASNPQHIHDSRVRPFTLTYEGRTWTANIDQVRQWFTVRRDDDSSFIIRMQPDRIYHFLNVHVSPQVNDFGERSRFILFDGNFHLVGPGRKGVTVDGETTSRAIRNAILSGKDTAEVRVQEYRPKIFSVDDFKRMRFPSHLGRGESNFAGSPLNRVHNIQVAMRKFNGIVLFPGEEFSFNQYLGRVNAENGYLPELVIRGNDAVPEFGGGVCQVSTTAFRAALHSGLQVTSRRNHSFPVHYYGTPGSDATVYAPHTDFRFRNDMSQPVYITTKIMGSRAIFDVWGTSEGREVDVIGPYVTSRRPDGSLTAAVAQIVKRNGVSIREQNFVSNYLPAHQLQSWRE